MHVLHFIHSIHIRHLLAVHSLTPDPICTRYQENDVYLHIIKLCISSELNDQNKFSAASKKSETNNNNNNNHKTREKERQHI